jgi:hypothetical protein
MSATCDRCQSTLEGWAADNHHCWRSSSTTVRYNLPLWTLPVTVPVIAAFMIVAVPIAVVWKGGQG